MVHAVELDLPAIFAVADFWWISPSSYLSANLVLFTSSWNACSLKIILKMPNKVQETYLPSKRHALTVAQGAMPVHAWPCRLASLPVACYLAPLYRTLHLIKPSLVVVTAGLDHTLVRLRGVVRAWNVWGNNKRDWRGMIPAKVKVKNRKEDPIREKFAALRNYKMLLHDKICQVLL